jgi:hypothetical protein
MNKKHLDDNAAWTDFLACMQEYVFFLERRIKGLMKERETSRGIYLKVYFQWIKCYTTVKTQYISIA